VYNHLEKLSGLRCDLKRLDLEPIPRSSRNNLAGTHMELAGTVCPCKPPCKTPPSTYEVSHPISDPRGALTGGLTSGYEGEPVGHGDLGDELTVHSEGGHGGGGEKSDIKFFENVTP
jgi:hypothetical protein